jgi:hypothetical protein
MKFDVSSLDHVQQQNFFKTIKTTHVEDGYYKVFFNRNAGEYLLMRVDFVIQASK